VKLQSHNQFQKAKTVQTSTDFRSICLKLKLIPDFFWGVGGADEVRFGLRGHSVAKTASKNLLEKIRSSFKIAISQRVSRGHECQNKHSKHIKTSITGIWAMRKPMMRSDLASEAIWRQKQPRRICLKKSGVSVKLQSSNEFREA